MMRFAAVAIALLVAIQPVAMLAADEIHVIAPKHRTAQKLSPVIRPLLRSDLDAVEKRNGLPTDRGSRLPKRLAEVERVVQQLDYRAPPI